MENSKALIIGGDFDDTQPRASSVIYKLRDILNSEIVNGGSLSDLETNANDLKGYKLVIWAPNITNEVEKIYPKKDTGSVLICTKVMRENRDFGDAVARVFKMNANAVIAIDSSEKPFKFTLIDALGNVWCSTSDLNELVFKIKEIYVWSSRSIRVNTTKIELTDEELPKVDLTRLCSIVKSIADKVENERGGRYFGNVSTRCGKMFPSYRFGSDVVLMSGRNVPKDRITPEDFVYTTLSPSKSSVLYNGEKKPSVDTPIQLAMYNHFKNINFLIHGHAYIEGVLYTNKYFPCGDLREFNELKDLLDSNQTTMSINLKNHGFVIGADNIDRLSAMAELLNFKYREIGIETVTLKEEKNKNEEAH
jgi:hypothetical protein